MHNKSAQKSIIPRAAMIINIIIITITTSHQAIIIRLTNEKKKHVKVTKNLRKYNKQIMYYNKIRKTNVLHFSRLPSIILKIRLVLK